jgi:hypothetical protein
MVADLPRIIVPKRHFDDRGWFSETFHERRLLGAALRARWGDCLIDDPYYNPILSLDPVPFSALAWPPRGMVPRVQNSPRPREIPPGF